jgi:hypothetical protein
MRRAPELTPQVLAKRQHHPRQAERKTVAGRLWRKHRLIFATEIGGPLDPENLSRAFAGLCN